MPNRVDLVVEASDVQIEPVSNGRIRVTVNAVDVDDLVKEAGADTLLDEIGKDEAVKHFDITEASDD